jgi:hypothetical protein
LLRSDFIPFKIIPVNGYADITKANEEFVQGNDDQVGFFSAV